MLTTLAGIPTRPTAQVSVFFDPYEQNIFCEIHEGTNKSLAIIYDGQDFSYPLGNGDTDRNYKLGDFSQLKGVKDDEEALCLVTLQRSDVFCPRQARSDFPKAMKSPFWNNLLNELKSLHSVASIMLV